MQSNPGKNRQSVEVEVLRANPLIASRCRGPVEKVGS